MMCVLIICFYFFFFFTSRRRHTRLQGDWSSDVCSSDLEGRRMSLVSVVLTLIIVGVLLWLINTYIPMQGAIKSIINIVVVIAVVLWLLYGFGIISHSGAIHLPAFK